MSTQLTTEKLIKLLQDTDIFMSRRCAQKIEPIIKTPAQY